MIHSAHQESQSILHSQKTSVTSKIAIHGQIFRALKMLEWMIQNIAWVAAGAVILLIGIKIVIFRVLKRLAKNANKREA